MVYDFGNKFITELNLFVRLYLGVQINCNLCFSSKRMQHHLIKTILFIVSLNT